MPARPTISTNMTTHVAIRSASIAYARYKLEKRSVNFDKLSGDLRIKKSFPGKVCLAPTLRQPVNRRYKPARATAANLFADQEGAFQFHVECWYETNMFHERRFRMVESCNALWLPVCRVLHLTVHVYCALCLCVPRSRDVVCRHKTTKN